MELAEFSHTSPQGLVKDVPVDEFMSNISNAVLYQSGVTNLYLMGLFHFIKK
jgi:hypothetical protein